jgi:hypothetical protein
VYWDIYLLLIPPVFLPFQVLKMLCHEYAAGS